MDFSLLELHQAFGDVIPEEYGRQAVLTDFSILLGAFTNTENGFSFYTKDGMTGWWWTRTCFSDTSFAIDSEGCQKIASLRHRDIGVRPIIQYSFIKSDCFDCLSNSEVKEVLFGEYPQTVVDKNTSLKLEELYGSNYLMETGKNYTTDSISIHEPNEKFEPMKHIEYGYGGNKYIRVIADDNSKNSILSDGTKVELGHAYWIKVEPITWLVDFRNDIALSKKILLSGIQFNNTYGCDNFKNTNIKRFLDMYFSMDIIPINKKNTRKQLLEEYKKLLKIKNSLIEETKKVDNEIEVIQLKLKMNRNSK